MNEQYKGSRFDYDHRAKFLQTCQQQSNILHDAIVMSGQDPTVSTLDELQVLQTKMLEIIERYAKTTE